MAAVPSYRRFKSNIRARSFINDGVTSITASASATRAKHSGRTAVVNAAAGLTITLPASRGQGDLYRFVVGTLLTSNTYVFQVANATDIMHGGVLANDIGDSAAATSDFLPTASTSDTLTMTASLGSGKIGDWVEFEDATSGHWMVRSVFQGVTEPTSPFSAGVS